MGVSVWERWECNVLFNKQEAGRGENKKKQMVEERLSAQIFSLNPIQQLNLLYCSSIVYALRSFFKIISFHFFIDSREENNYQLCIYTN